MSFELPLPFPHPSQVASADFSPWISIQMCVPRGAGAPSSPDSPTVTVSGLGLPSLVFSEPHTLASTPLPHPPRGTDMMGDGEA